MSATKLGLTLPCRRETKRSHISPLPFKHTETGSLSQHRDENHPDLPAMLLLVRVLRRHIWTATLHPQQVALASEAQQLQGWGHCQDGSMKTHQCRNRQWERTFIHEQPAAALALAVPAASFIVWGKNLRASSLLFQHDFRGTGWKEVERHRSNFRYRRDHVTQSESGKCIPKKGFSAKAGATFKNLNSVPAPVQEPKSDCRWIYPANTS